MSGAADARGTTPVDVVTREVVSNALGSVVDEMALIVMRTAHSGVVKDALDYSTAICDRDGQMVAQGVTIAMHLGSFPGAVASILERYGEGLAPGDVFVMNDPYGSGGIHLPDIYVIRPVFVDDALEAFACVVAHHTDVGGAIPGSNSTTTTEIYQEGLRIPTLKLFARGVPTEAIFELIRANVRVPDKVLGDLRAEITAAAAGDRGYQKLAERYGAAEMRRYTDDLLDYTERLARAEIARIPDGTWSFTSHIDNDSVDTDPVVIHASVTVDGDGMIVDLAGSSPQVRGGINSPLAFSRSAVYAAVRLVMDSGIPTSAGYFRAIEVRADERSVVNPSLPASCGARGITGFRVMDAVAGALAQAVPSRVPADGEGGNTNVSVGGLNPDGSAYVYLDLLSGARGGAPWHDGPEGVPHAGSNNANTPIEVIEAEYPVQFERYGLVPDTGGPGLHRGALAQVRAFQFLGDRGLLQLRSDKRRFRPYGLAGGGSGTPTMTTIRGADGRRRVLPVMGPTDVVTGDLFTHVTPGGGGWGDPLDRDPAKVLEDIRNEKISPAYARREYGVVVDGERQAVDAEATAGVRAGRRRRRAAPEA